MQRLKILITVKTYPVPSAKYDELVCTAGVTPEGDFVRLYPINFRDLPWGQQYRKYQWIEVNAQKHTGPDTRRESYRPDPDSLVLVGEPIPTRRGDWSERARYALAKQAQSLEELQERQAVDQTSLGVFRPKMIHDLMVSPADPDWKPSHLQALRQARMWEYRTVTKEEPPRKLPFTFYYRFECDDDRCRKTHRISIADWELGALFWKLVDKGIPHEVAAEKVREKFFLNLCGPMVDTHLFVGTTLKYPKSWLILGLFYPRKNNVLGAGSQLPLPFPNLEP